MQTINDLTIENSVLCLIDHQPWVAFPIHSISPEYDVAILSTEIYLSDLTPAMKPSDAYAHIARRTTQRVPIDQLEGRITTSLVTPIRRASPC